MIRQLRDIGLRRGTGLLSIVTDSGRAVLVRFAQGDIVGTHSRTKDIGAAIGVLLDAREVRFAYTPSVSEGGALAGGSAPMPVSAFIDRISPPAWEAPSAPVRAAGVAAGVPSGVDDREALGAGVEIAPETRRALERIAVEIVGPIAEFLVEEAVENALDLGDAVGLIARSIPDQAASARFLGEAKRRLRSPPRRSG